MRKKEVIFRVIWISFHFSSQKVLGREIKQDRPGLTLLAKHRVGIQRFHPHPPREARAEKDQKFIFIIL